MKQPEKLIQNKKKINIKQEQNNSKSLNNLSYEAQKKTENTKILNWRTERVQNQSPNYAEEENLPALRSKNINVSNQLNRLIVPKITNLNSYGVENSRHKDNTNLMKDIVRRRIETMGKCDRI